MSAVSVTVEVVAEWSRQDSLWGEQNHPDGTGGVTAVEQANVRKRLCQHAVRMGLLTWRDVLMEEVAEAFAESDPAALRNELIQVAAVAMNWVDAIDRREPT